MRRGTTLPYTPGSEHLGTVHVTDGLSAVPERYREKATAFRLRAPRRFSGLPALRALAVARSATFLGRRDLEGPRRARA
ncbi:MAG: hypothetical protein AMXMBFR34_12050 [Myxococcaceae bacterium]